MNSVAASVTRYAQAPARARIFFLPAPAVLQSGAVAGSSRAIADNPGAAPFQHVSTRDGQKTLLVNPPLVGGVAYPPGAPEREEVLGTTAALRLALLASMLRDAGATSGSPIHRRATPGRRSDRPSRSRGPPTLILFRSTTTFVPDVAEVAKLKKHFGAPMFCWPPVDDDPAGVDASRAGRDGCQMASRRRRALAGSSRQPRSAVDDSSLTWRRGSLSSRTRRKAPPAASRRCRTAYRRQIF